MSATVLSFFRPAPVTTGDWSQQELAEFYRVEAASVQAGLRLSLDRGLSDEGDPWLVFCREDGEVFLHFARIDGAYVVWSAMIDRPLTGPDFRALLTELASRNPSVLPLPRDTGNGRRGAQILMHPAALLAAIVATACLFSSMNEAVAGELDTGSHQGGHPSGGAETGTALTGEPGHAVAAHEPRGSEARAHDNFDRELTLITGVILACIATYATEYHPTKGVSDSPLSIPANGIVTASHSVSESAAAFEPGGGGQADTASHVPAGREEFKPLGDAATPSPAQAHLQDLRAGNLLPAAASPAQFLSSTSEPIPKAIAPGDVVVPWRGSHPIVAIGGGNGTPRPADPVSQRERAPAVTDQATAGGDVHGGGGDRGGDASPVTAGAPAAAEPTRTSPAAPAMDAGSTRSPTSVSQIAVNADSGTGRTTGAVSGADPGKTAAIPSATSIGGDGTKAAPIPTPDPGSVNATLAKSLAASIGPLSFGAIDLTKGIGAVFSDAAALSSKTVSLLLHALVDVQQTTADKGAPDLSGSLAGTVGKLAGLAAAVGSGTAVSGSGGSSSTDTDTGHAIVKAADAISATGAASVAAGQPPMTDAAKSVPTSGDPTKTVVVSSRPADLSADPGAHASTTTSSATVASEKAGIPIVSSQDPTASKAVVAATGQVPGGGTGAVADATGLTGPSGKAATPDLGTIAGTAVGTPDSSAQPATVSKTDHAGDLDALHAVAALTSSSNTVSRAVSVSLGASATVLDAVQLRIIDLFLQSTPDAKFRTVDNTLEIYDPSASREVSSHAALWDIGGGAFVRVIGITDTHIDTHVVH